MKARTLAIAIAFSALVTFLLFTLLTDHTASPPTSQAQTTAPPPSASIPEPDFEYEILPGLLSTTRSHNLLTISQFWHPAITRGSPNAQPRSIDFLQRSIATVGAEVSLLVNAVQPDKVGIFARVVGIETYIGSCRKVGISFFRPGVPVSVGEVLYAHVEPTVTIRASIDLSRVNVLGNLTQSSWVRVPSVRDDARAREIKAKIVEGVADGTLTEAVNPSLGYGNPQHVVFPPANPEFDPLGFRVYPVRFMFGEWWEQAWRSADGETADANHDAPGCPTTGPHLHQEARGIWNTNPTIWRNNDRPTRYTDNGMGMENAAYSRGSPIACSDDWLFKIKSRKPSGTDIEDWAPVASPVGLCGAPSDSPPNVTTMRGAGNVTVSWDAVSSATGYQYRAREIHPTSGGWSTWSSAFAETAAP